MAEVYRARDPKLNRDVAIKVLLPAVAADPERLTRFSREAQVLAALKTHRAYTAAAAITLGTSPGFGRSRTSGPIPASIVPIRDGAESRERRLPDRTHSHTQGT
jgi:serine/threonine protein kinase